MRTLTQVFKHIQQKHNETISALYIFQTLPRILTQLLYDKVYKLHRKISLDQLSIAHTGISRNK